MLLKFRRSFAFGFYTLRYVVVRGASLGSLMATRLSPLSLGRLAGLMGFTPHDTLIPKHTAR